MALSTLEKLEILADAAKYDASCASSGAPKRDSKNGGLGSTGGAGICHSYTPDGRCVSLLKVLLTNVCQYDCAYCINRRSSNVRRAAFTVEEAVKLTLDFYRANLIEGLFLSSGIAGSADRTMEAMVRVARELRETHGFKGYIHLKTIPEASPELILEAGRLADRLSINVELPTDEGLADLAPEKRPRTIRGAMARVKLGIDEAKAARAVGPVARRETPRFSPSGQSTQLIVGADGANDAAVLGASTRLYAGYGLKRVYYSAFSPIPDAPSRLPGKAPPLQREHRLYQADWLLRFYGFEADEVLAGGEDGMLSLAHDPKLAWALKHREDFPVDVNRAPRERLLRVPGLGVRTVDRVIAARRHATLGLADLARLAPMGRAKPFLIARDHTPARLLDRADLAARLVRPAARQLDLFAA